MEKEETGGDIKAIESIAEKFCHQKKIYTRCSIYFVRDTDFELSEYPITLFMGLKRMMLVFYYSMQKPSQRLATLREIAAERSGIVSNELITNVPRSRIKLVA